MKPRPKAKTSPSNAIDAHLGRRLRLRRSVLGLTQQDVASVAGMTFQQVQKYESGRNALSASRLHQFAAFLRVPVAFFFDGYGEPPAGAAQGSGHRTSDRELLELIKAFRLIKTQE